MTSYEFYVLSGSSFLMPIFYYFSSPYSIRKNSKLVLLFNIFFFEY